MARRIKFSLEVKDGVQARTLEDLQKYFDLEKTVGYFSDGRLLNWLEDRYYEREAEAVKALSKDDPGFYNKLCEALGVAPKEQLSQIDIELLEYRKERLEKLKQYSADKNIWKKLDCVAFDQEELADLLYDGEKEIILCNNKFNIPLKEKDRKYIGVGHVEVKISSKEKVDFDGLGIQFVNVKFDPEYEKIHGQTAENFLEMANSANDDEAAMKYLQMASDMGNARALYELGMKYMKGNGVPEDIRKALELFKKSADMGDTDAMFSLGNLYMVDDGVIVDKQEGVNWIKKAADAGNIDAIEALAEYYYDGVLLPKNYEKAIELFKKAANLGQVYAMINLGIGYFLGHGVCKDNKEALTWLNKALDAEQSSDAMFLIGEVYGDVEDEATYDSEKAFQWYLKAAELDDDAGMNEVGNCYRFGFGINENFEKAKEWYLKAANKGNSYAMTSLGFMYDCSAKEAPNLNSANELYKNANKWYRKAADAGNLVAFCNLAYNCLHGLGTGRSVKKAVKLYTVAAEKNHTDAMVSLGRIYSDSNESVVNYHKAIEWYAKAADEGNTDAMCGLGDLYRYGHGCQRNIWDAIKWYEKAANNGDADAMNLIGYIYGAGEGVPKNQLKAIEWYHKAANAGCSTAMCNIGYAYDEGDGEPQNYTEAIRWYKMAADAGDADAMRMIGRLYYNGNGVPKDVNLAMQWLQRSADAGDNTAKQWIEDIRSGNTEKGGKSGCFITTAVCDSLGKTDGCYELTMFRKFRDTWLQHQKNGDELIKEYYCIAPCIVSNINQHDNSEDIYKTIWQDYLKPCLVDLESNNPISCKEHYIKMVIDLKKKYYSLPLQSVID